MNKIYDLYDALVTIKHYCMSNENARIVHSLIMLIVAFLSKIQHHQIGNWLSQHEDYMSKRREKSC